MPNYDVFLVEDHTIVRSSLRAMLERTGEFRVVGEVDHGADAIRFCKEHSVPDLVLMDLSMPVLNGVEATAELTRHFPSARVVVLSAYDEEKSIVEVIKARARGYLLKRAGIADLIEALRAVAGGGSYLSPQISSALFHRLQNGEERIRRPGSDLSPRESQVMRLVAQGLTSKEIASTLDLGVETVRSYRKTLMKKLGVNNAAGITRLPVEAMSPTGRAQA
jgi:two-component system response regulator NreC